MFDWTPDRLGLIRDYPHLIGYMVGKTKLTRLHSDWIKLIWDTPRGQNNALQAHRGAYKTTALTEIGTIYYLLFHPSARIAVVRETYTEAAKTVDTIKKYMLNEAVQSLFTYAHHAKPRLLKAGEGVATWSFKRTITKENNLDAYGINQVPTGSHYDVIICDDIVTLNSRLSHAKREAVKQGVQEILTNILDPGANGFFVGTPWHYDDAWALKNEDGELVIPRPYQYRPADTGILSPQEIAKKKSTTTRALYAINYELDPSVKDEGQVFDEPIYGPWDSSLPLSAYHAHIDAAWEGDCTTAVTVMARNRDGLIQARGKLWTENVMDLLMPIIQFIRGSRSRILHLETNPDKGMLAREFKRVASTVPGYTLTPIKYAEHENKDIKIVTYLKKYWSEIRWDPDGTDPAYLLQVQDYRLAQDPRDCADSAASLLREAFYGRDRNGGHSALNTL